MKEIYMLLDEMKSSPIRNYVVAGLDSYLLENGKVRYFQCSRNHQDQITPHSHRFDFACFVIDGSVTNRVWGKIKDKHFGFKGDLFEESTLVYSGEVGSHKIVAGEQNNYIYEDNFYKTGDKYFMFSHEIHSIYFSKNAKVLFFEGPEKSNESKIIQPVVNGEIIQTYKKEPYMFRRDQ